MTERPPVLISGMFDMDNYGDLLFPVVARHRLAAAGHTVVAAAPSARPAAFPDALAPVDLSAMTSGETPVSGIVIGGGYVVHTSSLDFLDRYNGDDVGAWAGAGIWLGATLAAALRDVPVVWNAPGVPHPFSTRQGAIVAAALRAASYVAVRDAGSRALLPAAGDVAVAVVPDPILDLPSVWPKADLAGAFRGFLARKGLSGEERLLAIHVRNRSIAGLDRAALAAALAAFARTEGLTLMLVAVGESHDDPAVARDLARHVAGSDAPPLVLLDDPRGLAEITAALAHSALYLGASLHGYVVAAAYGVPGVLVGRPAYNKFTGLLGQIGRMDDFARDWDAAIAKAAARRPAAGPIVPAAALAALDEHWRRIVAALDRPDERREARRDFALAVLAAALDREGPGWAMAPLLNARMRGAPTPTSAPTPIPLPPSAPVAASASAPSPASAARSASRSVGPRSPDR